MKINACIIIKDDSEIDNLKRCLLSFIDYVDGVYITSTNKPDFQIQQLVENINKEYKQEVAHYSYFEWVKDFSKARNFNFSQAPQDSDFLFWVDVDDIVVHAENLRWVAKQAIDGGKDIVFLPYWYGCTFDGEPSLETLKTIDIEQRMRERLMRPGVTRWVNRLHETPIPNDGVKNQYTTYKYDEENYPLAIMHGSSLDEAEKKLPRNRELLELQLHDEREKGEADPRTLLYLMKIYAESATDKETLEKTIEMGNEYLTKSGWDEERGTCLENMGIAAGSLGRDQEAIGYFFRSLKEWPHQPMIYLRLATSYFNIRNYRLAYFWMNQGASIDIDAVKNSMVNLHGMKVMSTDLLMRLNFREDFKDTKVAYEAAQQLFELKPTRETKGMLDVIEDAHRLNEACKNTDELAKYLSDTGYEEQIVPILDQLPFGVTAQPFAQKLRQKFSQPRVWGKDEICYFANFYQNHFEKWSPKSLETGIGGSETAVIELAKRWKKLGYKVTVYGDPGEFQGIHDGVTYLPWYYFNHRDSFNIFIQWRSWFLADKIKSKLFLCDIHDIYSPVDVTQNYIDAVDYFMVKSNYHRNIAPNIPDEKFKVIGNGI